MNLIPACNQEKVPKTHHGTYALSAGTPREKRGRSSEKVKQTKPKQTKNENENGNGNNKRASRTPSDPTREKERGVERKEWRSQENGRELLLLSSSFFFFFPLLLRSFSVFSSSGSFASSFF